MIMIASYFISQHSKRTISLMVKPSTVNWMITGSIPV